MVSPTIDNLRAVVDKDGAAILDIERDAISLLNCTGAYVWQGLKRGETLERIIANLACDTGEGEQRVDRDVREFVKTLAEKHLLPR